MSTKSTFRQGIAWGMYDFANSGYFLVYIVLTFPLFLSSQLMTGDVWFEAKWGVAQGAAIALAVVLGLLLGKTFDRIGIHKVVHFALLAAGFSSLIIPLLVALHAGGALMLTAFAVMHAIYLLSLTIYDSSLKHIATGEASIEVSGWAWGWAWGWGYVGGLFCIGLITVGNLFWSQYSALTFLVGSLFFLVFSYLASRSLRKQLKHAEHRQQSINEKTEKSHSQGHHTEQSTSQSKEVGAIVSPHKRLQLLILFVLIVDGIAVFMGFFSLYVTKVIGASDADVLKMVAVLQILAFPLTGLLSGIARKSFRGLLWFCGFSWITATLLVVFAPTVPMLWLSIIIIAGAVGTTQSLLRAVYADTLSTSKAIQGFGVFAVVEKGAAFIGPFVAGILIPLIGYGKVILAAGIMVAVGCLLVGRQLKNKQL